MNRLLNQLIVGDHIVHGLLTTIRTSVMVVQQVVRLPRLSSTITHLQLGHVEDGQKGSIDRICNNLAFDFGGLPDLMAEGLSARMLMEHRDAQVSVGGARRRMSWRGFILALGLHTDKKMQTAEFSAYWANSARQIPDKGDLRDYWIGISSAGDIRGTTPSYIVIRYPTLRLCHRLIACNMALPPREQRHPFLRYQGLEYTYMDIKDFEAILARIYRREGALVHEFILEFYSTFMFGHAKLDLDMPGALQFQLGELGGIGISSAGDIRGTTPSYTVIRYPTLRLCHRLIACSIAGRIQAPKKVTVTDLFYLRGIDFGSVNVPYLLARYLRLFAAGRKNMAHISGGQFVARLAEHFGLLTAEILGGLTVTAPELPIIDMTELCPPDSYHPPNPIYETYSCKSCGNDSHFGYDCPPRFHLNYEPELGYIQSYDDEDYTIAITPDLPITDSLSMRDEHLSTIAKTELNELIKSSVENLVPNPSESEDLSNIGSECSVPVGDNFTTFSYSLFDADDNFSSSDDESFFDEDVPKEIYSNPLFDEEIISIKIDPCHFNAESDLIESLLNQYSLIISSPNIDYLLEEFSGELAHIDLISPRINKADFDPEEEIRLVKKLLYDNSSPDLRKNLILKILMLMMEFTLSPIREF
nr:hypothetical protein [Tanacetum cinerariifolium]